MSRVYFHTQTQDALIGGAERGWWGNLCRRLCDGLFDITHFCNTDRVAHLRRFIAPSHPYLNDSTMKSELWADRFLAAFHVDHRSLLVYKGHDIDAFSLMLNTALAVGGDAFKLAARLHGSCEIHCWIADENREWIAGIIERGVSDGVLRKSSAGSNHRGYDDAIKLLRHPEHRGPVVCSYSVCEQFPGVRLIERGPNEGAGMDDEEWREHCYDMPKDRRWQRSFDALVAKDGGLELKPDNWDSFRFGHRLSVLDLMSAECHERLDSAVADGRL